MMKYYSLLVVIVFILVGFAVTGFQCGSADVTSAKLYIQHEEWDKAEASLTKEVTKNPANAEAWFLLGQTRMKKLNFSGMMDAFNNSLKINKEFEKDISNNKMFVWGQTLNQGVGFYNRYVSAVKENSQTPKDSARMFLDQAIAAYDTALIVNPDSAITYQNLAIAYHLNGNVDQEISTMKEAVKRKPADDEYTSIINAYIKKGDAATDRNNKQEATEDYNNAIESLHEARAFDPSNQDFLSTMIELYVKLNRTGEAKPYMYEAIAKDPGNKILHFNVGVLLMQGDNIDSIKAAITHFDAALQSDPNYEPALQNIAVCNVKIGSELKQAAINSGAKENSDKSYIPYFKKAAEYFQRLTVLKPAESKYYDALATAYANAEMTKEARKAFEKADALRKK